VRHCEELKASGIAFLDVGTSRGDRGGEYKRLLHGRGRCRGLRPGRAPAPRPRRPRGSVSQLEPRLGDPRLALLVELVERELREHLLEELSGYVEDTREVKWAVQYALEKETWIAVIAQSELALYRYRDPDSAASKGVALLRHGVGGHPLHKKAERR
jgi:6-phosphogluconate dehydrogenase (decarboxylating)